MTTIFAGAAPYEFVNVPALVTTGATFDPNYVEGSISKTSDTDHAMARLFKTPTAQEVWLHAKVLLGSTLPDVSAYNRVLAFHDANLNRLGGLSCSWVALNILSGTTVIDITPLVPRNVLCEMDIHMFQSGSVRVVELYVDGNFVAQARSTIAWVAPDQVIMGGMINSANYFSEVLVMEGNAPTIGMRLHSKRPNPSLPGLNTFDSGYWGALANGSLTDGVVTTKSGARLTGGFMPYTGPASPLGIRGIVQSARYLKNGTLLNLKGSLRIEDVNYDNPDFEFDDGARLLSIWEENPATEAPFIVDDFAGLQGGFLTAL